MKKILIPLMILLSIGSVLAVCDEYVDSCRELNVSGTTYCMNTSIFNHGDCFVVKSNNVTLDCQGFNLTGNNTGYGFYDEWNSYPTIKNCNMTDWNKGVYLKNIILYPTVQNNNITSCNRGIDWGYDSKNGTIEYNTFRDNTAGIWSQYGQRYTNVSHNTFIGNTLGFDLDVYNILINDNTADGTVKLRDRSTNIILEDNNFHNFQESNIFIGSGNNDFYNNVISGNYTFNSRAKINGGHIGGYLLVNNINQGALDDGYFNSTNFTGYTRNVRFSSMSYNMPFVFTDNGAWLNLTYNHNIEFPRTVYSLTPENITWLDAYTIGGSAITWKLNMKPDTVMNIFKNGVFQEKKITDSDGYTNVNGTPWSSIWGTYEVSECLPDWNVVANTTVCHNSTNLINEVDYYDLNDCSANYTDTFYPVLEYNLSSNVTTCFNSTTRLLNETYTDISSCSESYDVLTYTNVPDELFYECVGAGVFSYTGSCGDGTCYSLEGEDQINCCTDCGCPVFFRCTSNVCYEKTTERVLTDAGEGVGNFLELLTNPIVTSLLVFGVMFFALTLIYVIATSFEKIILGGKN